MLSTRYGNNAHPCRMHMSHLTCSNFLINKKKLYVVTIRRVRSVFTSQLCVVWESHSIFAEIVSSVNERSVMIKRMSRMAYRREIDRRFVDERGTCRCRHYALYARSGLARHETFTRGYFDDDDDFFQSRNGPFGVRLKKYPERW